MCLCSAVPSAVVALVLVLVLVLVLPCRFNSPPRPPAVRIVSCPYLRNTDCRLRKGNDCVRVCDPLRSPNRAEQTKTQIK